MELTISILAGLLIAALFYWLATRDLLAESKKLRHLNEQILEETKKLRIENTKLRHLTALILLALQNSGMADLRFDKDGSILGLNINVTPITGDLKFE